MPHYIFFPVSGGGGSTTAPVGTITTTGQDLVAKALRLLQILAAGATPSPEDAQDGFEVLNEIIDSLHLEPSLAVSKLRAQYPLTGGVQQYTIGAGGTFNQPWPESLDLVSVIPDRTAAKVNEIPIGRPLTWAEFQKIVQKAQTSPYPTVTFFDRLYTNGLGRIWVYPVPTTSICDLVLYTPNLLGLFATRTTKYNLRPGYARLLKYQLAMALADDFESEVSDTVKRTADRLLAFAKRANFEPQYARLDPMMPGLRHRSFNPWTGE